MSVWNTVLKQWVGDLGLRHQGVLVSAIRGCDNVPREDPSKDVVRAYRGVILHSFSEEPSSFIEYPNTNDLIRRFNVMAESIDHYPLHFLLHLLYAVEIVGYKHPKQEVRAVWFAFYASLCSKMHLGFETEAELDNRLLADEEIFASR